MDFFAWIEKILVTGEWLQALLCIGGLIILWMLWRIQVGKNRIDFRDILLGPDGKASGSKIMQLGAFAVSTWGFIFIIIHNALTEYYFTAYMIAWSGSQIASRWLSIREYDKGDNSFYRPMPYNQQNGQVDPGQYQPPVYQPMPIQQWPQGQPGVNQPNPMPPSYQPGIPPNPYVPPVVTTQPTPPPNPVPVNPTPPITPDPNNSAQVLPGSPTTQ